MSDVEITVRGSASEHAEPERARVRLNVTREGDDAEQVSGDAARLAADVRSSIEPLHDAERGPVVAWSSDLLRTWSNRPWHPEGEQLPLVHHALVAFVVEFSDFSELGVWLSARTRVDGIEVAGVEWKLSTDHQDELLAGVRAAAVADARRKAEAYAAAVGLGRVAVLAIADAGMLGEGLHPTTRHEGVFAAARMDKAAPPDFELTPQPIAVTAEVDARFLAS